jgi:hypothetical protein
MVAATVILEDEDSGLKVSLNGKITDSGIPFSSSRVYWVIRCPISSYDQQGNVRNNIEHQKDNLEQREERVNGHVKGIPRDGKPFALHAIHPITGECTNHGRQDKPDSIYDCTPHEKCLKRIPIHDVPPFKPLLILNIFSLNLSP